VIPRPISPYGVTKLAGENLCYLYWKGYEVPTVALRFFTVYGPRQRPDMAFHRFIKRILNDEEIEIYSDGAQTRDFTFVTDIINGILLAKKASSGEVYNIGGGTRTSLIDTIRILEKLLGKKAKIKQSGEQKGDVRDTWADIEKVKNELGYTPSVVIEEGLRKEILWTKSLYHELKNN